MHKNLIIAGAFGAAAGLAASVALAADKTPEWLFVQTASGIEVLDERTLGVSLNRDVFAFTDRPYRKHHYLSADQFAAVWDDNAGTIAADPPNATIVWDVDGVSNSIEVELLGAQLSDRDGSIHYDISPGHADLLSDIDSSAALYVDGLPLSDFGVGYPGEP